MTGQEGAGALIRTTASGPRFTGTCLSLRLNQNRKECPQCLHTHDLHTHDLHTLKGTKQTKLKDTAGELQGADSLMGPVQREDSKSSQGNSKDKWGADTETSLKNYPTL